MEVAVTQTIPLATFTLPGSPYSVQLARFYVQAALSHYGLGDHNGDVEAVTSELVSNAMVHANARTIELELMRVEGSEAVVVVVKDPSPDLPAMRDLVGFAEHGRGLHVVDALAARWGWTPHDPPGKAVFAIFAKEG
jgi:anti-sigma regulatory factor (Ser/Thr protein kinase)